MKNLKNRITDYFISVWDMFSYSIRFFREFFIPPFEINEILKQTFILAYKSLPLVSITGLIIGLTLALQLKPTLVKFGAESLIPSLLSISIIREIGPVIISLICAGKMGSAIGAELGSMKVTEQISAMEVSAVRPFRYLVIPRVTATTIGVPLLILYANAIALIGGFIAISLESDMSFNLYISLAFETLWFDDIIPSFLKTFLFGFAIGIVGSYKGYNCSRGTESVGLAANSSVVTSSLLIILLDMIAVQVTNILY